MKGKYGLAEHFGELICQFLQHYCDDCWRLSANIILQNNGG